MRQHVGPANLVTSTSLVLGFLALLCAPQRPAVATGLVLLAAVLDVVDGALARRAGGDRTFGAQLDSLTDLLCFCVVPAFVLHHAVSSPLGAVAASAFLVAGAWRLARFPLVQQSGSFVGLPTPAGGGLLMVLSTWAPAPVAVGAGVVLAGLMASTVRFPSVLAAAGRVRPGHRTHALRRRLVRRPALVPRVLRRPRRPSRRPGRPRRAQARAGQLLGALRRGRPRRR